MATCYKCGAANANYRRTTYTGSSTTNWWSKRSFGSGSRTYYGLRSVCEDCAKAIDRWNTIKLILRIAAIATVIYFVSNHFFNPSRGDGSTQSNSSYYYSGETARVVATKGLNPRDVPNSGGTVLITVPYNETIGIIDKNGDSETISGQTANWYKVDYKGTVGWLWSGYLQVK